MSSWRGRSISDGGVDTSFAAKFARILGCSDHSSIQSLPPVKLHCPKTDASQPQPADCACNSPTRGSTADSTPNSSAHDPKCFGSINVIGPTPSATPTVRLGRGKSVRLADLSRSAPEGKMQYSPKHPNNFSSSSKRQDDKHLLDTIARCLTEASMHRPLNLTPASEKRVASISVTNTEGDVSVRPLRMTKSSPLLKHEASSSPSKGRIRLSCRRSMDSPKFLETILQITAETNARAGSKYNCGGMEHRQMIAAAAAAAPNNPGT